MNLSHLYETDETAWLEKMSRLAKKRQFEQLDCENLSEYLLAMAKRDRREVLSRLTVLLAHLLKSDFQPRKRSRSWANTIRDQRYELNDLLDSKTLRKHALDVLPTAYARAVQKAADETGLAVGAFPPDCPYTLDEILAAE